MLQAASKPSSSVFAEMHRAIDLQSYWHNQEHNQQTQQRKYKHRVLESSAHRCPTAGLAALVFAIGGRSLQATVRLLSRTFGIFQFTLNERNYCFSDLTNRFNNHKSSFVNDFS